jgi:hypothetical protein
MKKVSNLRSLCREALRLVCLDKSGIMTLSVFHGKLTGNNKRVLNLDEGTRCPTDSMPTMLAP